MRHHGGDKRADRPASRIKSCQPRKGVDQQILPDIIKSVAGKPKPSNQAAGGQVSVMQQGMKLVRGW
jgi:hypothetical protein